MISKALLICDEDVQILHGFDTVANAQAHLTSDIFTNNVVRERIHGWPAVSEGAADSVFSRAPQCRNQSILQSHLERNDHYCFILHSTVEFSEVAQHP